MLERNLSARLGIDNVLPLAGILLDEIIGDKEAQHAMAERYAQAVTL